MPDDVFVLHLPQGHRLSAASGGEGGRFDRVLLAPHPDGGNVKDAALVATDGRMVAVLPVTVSGPDGEPLAAPVPAQLLPAAGLDTDDDGLDTDDDGLPAGRVVRRYKFPDAHAVFPDADKVAGYTTVSLATDLLRELTAAISPSGFVTLLVPPPQDGRVTAPVVVIGHDDGQDGLPPQGAVGVGLIMPRVCEDPGEDAKRRDEMLARYGALVAMVPARCTDGGARVEPDFAHRNGEKRRQPSVR
jgi:hypothetical protein